MVEKTKRRRKNMKKATAIIITLILAFSITACDGNGNSEGGGRTYSETEYNRLKDERDRLQGELDALKNNGGNSSDTSGNNSSFGQVSVGDMIQLGGLDWLVLAVEDGKALVLSDKVLERRAYQSDGEKTWESSDLREYLNGSFYNSTFNDQEKNLIIETELVNANNPDHGTAGGNSTRDKVFLLSIDEVNKYMGDEAHIIIRSAIIAKSLATDEASWWWLRSPGRTSHYTVVVHSDGYISDGGFSDGGGDGRSGVRPALWINL
jgi:hypothetical protein